MPVSPPRTRQSTLSTSLLDDLWADALDPAYAAATRARHDHPVPARVRSSLLIGVIAAALIGGAVAVGATQVRLASRQSAGTKTALIDQVQQAETLAGGLSRTQDTLRMQVNDRRQSELSTTTAGAAANAAIGRLELQTAGSDVTGPGVVITVADAPDAGSGSPTQGRVEDRDLQAVANALWAAGAEAVSVDGERLGPGTAIRTAGETILVDFRPVTSPYLVQAIGSANALETGYASSEAGAQLAALEQFEGITVTVTGAAHLHLAAASTPLPDHAAPLTSSGSSG
jgi:uncharacterized protein YlxW (UPF0749 family)